MRVLAFVRQYLGVTAQAPGGIGGQCVDLANLYLLRCRGLQPVRLNAVDWAGTTIPGMVWEANQATNSPPLGSLVVWHSYKPHGIGQFGHIALALVGDPMELVTFDQDWPIGSPCALVVHDYGGVSGWHRPT